MKRFLRGFVYAGKGLFLCVRAERNFRIHLCAAVFVIFLAARYYAFDALHWAVLLATVFGVLTAEAVNSAVERAVGLPDEAHDALAGQAKDLAAGAVLLCCIGAVCVGVALFWPPEGFAALLRDWAMHPWVPALLVVYIVGSYIFVFLSENKRS